MNENGRLLDDRHNNTYYNESADNVEYPGVP